MSLEYTPFSDRTIDSQYRDLLTRILKTGHKVDTQQEEAAYRVHGHEMRFNLANGFPIITERDLCSAPEGKRTMFQLALGELFAFRDGARTLAQMKEYGCGWWSRWVTPAKCAKRGLETGDLGPGSYGPAWRSFPTAEGSPFDQFKHVLEQIEELPHLRTHFVSPWIPQYIGRGAGKQQRVVVAPCHGWLHILCDPTAKELSMLHFQRSGDVPVGVVGNMIQYAALALMIGQQIDYRVTELVYYISDAHIYVNQVKDVEELLATEPQRFPTVTLDPSVKHVFDFKDEHFKVEDYMPRLPRRMIWTPV